MLRANGRGARSYRQARETHDAPTFAHDAGETLTSTMQMSLLDPVEHGMDMTMEVVPSVFGVTIFTKNVWEGENLRHGRGPYATVSASIEETVSSYCRRQGHEDKALVYRTCCYERRPVSLHREQRGAWGLVRGRQGVRSIECEAGRTFTAHYARTG